MSWFGGVNYNYNRGGTMNSFIADMQLYISFGGTRVRLNQPVYTNPSSITQWRAYVVQALNMGLYVIYGVTFNYNQSSTVINQAIWPAYVAGVKAEADWATTLNNHNLEFSIGNELERQRYATVSSLSQVAGTATAITAYPHNFTTGETVVIRQATSGYNGSFVITVTNATTFTFGVSAGITSPATSPGQVTDYTDAGIVAAISQLSDTVANNHYPFNLTYSAPTGSPDSQAKSGNIPVYWFNNGIGSLTRLGFNTYTYFVDSQGISFVSLTNYIISHFNLSQIQYTEYNLDSGNAFAVAGGTDMRYEQIVHNMFVLLQTADILSYFYNFTDALDMYSLVTTTGTYRRALATLAQTRPWFTNGSVPVSRPASVTRSATPARGASVSRPSYV